MYGRISECDYDATEGCKASAIIKSKSAFVDSHTRHKSSVCNAGGRLERRPRRRWWVGDGETQLAQDNSAATRPPGFLLTASAARLGWWRRLGQGQSDPLSRPGRRGRGEAPRLVFWVACVGLSATLLKNSTILLNSQRIDPLIKARLKP